MDIAHDAFAGLRDKDPKYYKLILVENGKTAGDI